MNTKILRTHEFIKDKVETHGGHMVERRRGKITFIKEIKRDGKRNHEKNDLKKILKGGMRNGKDYKINIDFDYDVKLYFL